MNIQSLSTSRKTLTAGLLATLLSACAVGPDYHRPELAPVTAFRNAPATDAAAQNFEARWWTQFGDPTLDALVSRAVSNSLDLRMAVARVTAARAAVGDAQSNQLPTIGADASYTRSRAQQPGFGSDRFSISRYQAGFDAAWELDLAGGIRRSVEAAQANSQASVASLRDAQVRLIAEVARNYFELRGAQLRLEIASRDLASQSETVKLTRVRREVGTGPEQDVASASARLAATEARIPLLRAAEKLAGYRLDVLTGARPGESGVDLSPQLFKTLSSQLAIGAPQDLLARRPDVQRAERELAAATAGIGIATADFYPHIEVGGFIGFLSGNSADLGTVASQAFSIGPSISWNGLNWKRVQSRLDQSKANADEAFANYQQTVLLALEDIEGSLTLFNTQRERSNHLLEQAQQSRRAADLAGIRYREGATDFLVLLDAQRTALAAEDELAQAETAINTSAIAVYKALGGGWEAGA
ncbi:efflux transporter outer membrane subunit [Nevskia ramosa]|uniref:efflux transporter outer membrane subunit n=1 Tax=Nevskia ramosa TaxID=64002 RepID=UPI0003B51486|nr:TolC family protein [Nevskia ramosa]